MKAKLKYDFRYVDEDEEMECVSTIMFDKGTEYDVLHQFESQRWGVKDHTVFVLINENGETMSISKEICEVIE